MSGAGVQPSPEARANGRQPHSASSGRRLRIFFVCLRVPFPPDRGDKITTFNLVRHLSQTNDVHVFCLGDPSADADNVQGLGRYVSAVTAVPLSRVYDKLRGIKALLTGTPLSIALRDEPGLHRAVASAFRRHRPDLMIAYSSNTAQFVPELSSVPLLMYFGDLDSMKWSAYAARTPFPLDWIYRREARLLLEHERGIARASSHSLVCTEAERDDFERLIPGAPVEVLQNGVDVEYFRPRGRGKRSGTMVFTGVMDYFPNVDGARWFCDEVLPLIQQAVPHANLVICGRNPTRVVTRLADRRGVRVTGEVADVRPCLDAAEICVVPLRIARGIQNKILEGMAMGLPCVASRAACQGLTIEAGSGVLAADDPRQFADHAIRLLRDEDFRSQMARKAREAIETTYTWEAPLRQLDRLVERLVAPAGADRRRYG